jgi:hypothetical protein
MLKLSFFRGEGEAGPSVVPLFGPADRVFEKTAAPTLLPEVVRYIGSLTPRHDAQYVLVNAMGATEWYGSNVNGDSFPEASLLHRPDDWRGNPLVDRISARSWPYGYPTFYNAHAFAHHRNKDPNQAFGDVELAAWHPAMKRVELVVRVDKDKCIQHGGIPVWDKLRAGQYPDVSMGTKVPYDTCSICLDRKLYQKALATFDPKKHRHPGMAALEFHKKLKSENGVGIRGLSITRKDYCQHAKELMNRILPDGRKVWVDNDYPSFFDISFVFIGADRTAKTMLFVFSGGTKHAMRSSAEMAEHLGARDEESKTASVGDEILARAFGKDAERKSSEISKDTIPSQFAGKAIPMLAGQEPEIDTGTLNQLSRLPMPGVMSTLSSMGIVLQPMEFQRITLMRLGMGDVADELDSAGVSFPPTDEVDPLELSARQFMPALARLLEGLVPQRSGHGPVIERRIIMMGGPSEERPKKRAPGELKLGSSVSSELLCKLSAAYNGYRDALMDVLPHSQVLLRSAGHSTFEKLAATPVEEMFTPLSVQYFQQAHRPGLGDTSGRMVHIKS